MNYDPEKHHRRSIRVPDYDYSQNGWYFVTICAQNREWMFGNVNDGKMELNKYGKIVDEYWCEIINHFDHVELDGYIIMPNHMHGIVIINGGNCRGEVISPLQKTKYYPTLGQIIAYFKYQSTKHINQLRGTPGIKLWQRNYGESHVLRHYEHIIRDDNDLNRISQYIINNPLNWSDDRYYK